MLTSTNACLTFLTVTPDWMLWNSCSTAWAIVYRAEATEIKGTVLSPLDLAYATWLINFLL